MPFIEAVSGFADPVVAGTLLREVTAVNNRRGIRLETEATGTAPFPKGTKTYAYMIDMGERAPFRGNHEFGQNGLRCQQGRRRPGGEDTSILLAKDLRKDISARPCRFFANASPGALGIFR